LLLKKPCGESSLRWLARHIILILATIASIPTLSVHAAGSILLGQQLVTPTLDSDSAGTAEAFMVTASVSGTITSLSAYVDASSKAKTLIVGLYSDKSGTPGSLLTQGTLSSPVASTWNTVPVPNANVVAGSVYWIALLGPAGKGILAFRDSDPNGRRSETSKLGNLTTLPSTWSTGKAWSSSPVSAYGSSAAASQPVLSVSPSSLIFTAVAGGSDPLPAPLTINNTGIGTLSFTANSDSGWLSLSPTSGTAPPSVTAKVSATVGTLAAGSYSGNITITAAGAQGSPATIPVSFSVSSSTPPPAGSDWPTYGHDQQRSGNAAGESLITRSSVNDLALQWSASVDGKVTAQPLFISSVQVGGTTRNVVVVATASNSIYALDASNGAQLWRMNFGAPLAGKGAIPGGFGISGAPVIDKTAGRVYTVTDNGYLRTLSLADGTAASPAVQVITDNPATNSVWGGLNLVGGNLYIATASDGNDDPPWWGRIVQVNVSQATASVPPVIANIFKVVPSIAIPNGGGGIWGYGGVPVDPATGNVYAATSADSNEVYTPYAVRMLSLSTNLALNGSFEPPHTSPCVGDPGACDEDFGATPIIYQPSGCPTLVAAVGKDGYIHLLTALDLSTRTSETQAQAAPLQSLALNIGYDGPGKGGITGVPAYWPSGNMLFVTDGGPGITDSAGNHINAGVVGLTIAPSPTCNLQVAWSVDWTNIPQPLSGDNQPPSSPTVANGVVFVGSGVNGSVHAYDAISGTELWNSGSAIASGATFAAPMVANGVLYTASWNGFGVSDGGTVRAFAQGSPPPPPPPSHVLLGDQLIESQLDDNVLGLAEAFQSTASASGTVGALLIYLDASSTAATLVAGLYADSAGHPGALIAQGSSSALTPGAWNTITIPGAIVTSGNPYWIAVLGTQSGTLRFRDRNGGCNSETSTQSNLTSLPSSWATGKIWPSCPLSGYGISTGP
jgi:outer membrane protein assembly factor BamB